MNDHNALVKEFLAMPASELAKPMWLFPPHVRKALVSARARRFQRGEFDVSADTNAELAETE